MPGLRNTFTRAANAALRPVGAEVVRAGLLAEKAATINALLDEQRAEADAQTEAVQQALALNLADRPALTPAPHRLAAALEQTPHLASRELFTLNGQLLPCWREADTQLFDDWLLNPRNFPVYHALFRLLSAEHPAPRLVEIGVRTGYVATAFARAVGGPSYYVGVDPNEYVANGLDYAAETLRQLRAALPGFQYALWEGYSWRRSTQTSLEHAGPFDLVHVDGDHRLAGKVIDLDLARRLVGPGGLVLVDDFDHHPPVADAIRRALALGWYRGCTYLPTLRGLALLEL